MFKQIKPGLSETDICTTMLHERGITDSWNHNVLVFVLVGDRTVLSMSGRVYQPSDSSIVATNDLITIDLAPFRPDEFGY